jgi:hypothetical protein
VSRYEIRDRDGQGNLDGSAPSRPFMAMADGLSLVDVLRVAVRLGRTVDVWADDRYVVSYCGGCPSWWLPGTTGAHMHQMSSLGWCNDCLDELEVYVHHLSLADEIAVLTETALTDKVLRRQVEADGQTAAEYAVEVAGQAVAKDGYDCLAVFIRPGGTFLGPQGLMRQFEVRMKDARTVLRVAVPYDPRPEQYMSCSRDLYAARDLAEQLAYDRPGRAPAGRCHDCRGTKGHARDCSVTREREFLAKYPHLAAGLIDNHPHPERLALASDEE